MADSPSLLADRRLFGLLLLAALLRLVIGLDVWSNDPTSGALLSDSQYYQDWALSLIGQANFDLEGGQLAYWMPPLYARLLAWLSASTQAMLVVQGIAGLMTTCLIVAIGDRLFQKLSSGRKAALWGGLVWTLYGPVIFFEGRLLAASFATLLASLALLFAIRWHTSRKPFALVLCGALLGLMSLLRPNTMLAIPALLIWVCWVERQRLRPIEWIGKVALLLLPALIVLAPSLVHNFRATGALVPVTTNGGINFYFGNNPASRGTFHAPGIEWGSINKQRMTARRLAAEGLGRPLEQVSDPQASRYWFKQGIDFWTRNPTAAMALIGLKAADLFSSSEFGIQYNLPAARTRAPSLWLVGLPFGLLLFLAVLGWQRKHNALVVTWLAAGLLSALAFFTYSRFRLPLLPILMPFCGLGLVRLVQSQVRFRQLLLGSLFFALSYIPFEGDYPAQLKSHAFLDMTAALGSAPQTAEERSELLDAALDLVPGNKLALVARAQVAMQQDEAQLALEKLEAAAQLSIEYSSAEFELARLLATIPGKQRDLKRARSILKTWLNSHPLDDPAAPSFRELAAALAKIRQE